MKKRITRLYKTIIAEVITEVPTMYVSGKFFTEIIVDKKSFSRNILMFEREPNEQTYRKANVWADEVIRLHEENTNSIPVKKKIQIAYFCEHPAYVNHQAIGIELIWIKDRNAIYGRTYDGALIHNSFRFMGDEQKKAFDELKNRQPELFKKIKMEV